MSGIRLPGRGLVVALGLVLVGAGGAYPGWQGRGDPSRKLRVHAFQRRSHYSTVA